MNHEQKYTYPQSSCTCWDCKNNKIEVPKMVENNTLIPTICNNTYFECDNIYISAQNTEPLIYNNGRKILNYPNKNRIPPNFQETTHNSMKKTYSSIDPRLRHGMTGESLILDRPPTDSSIKLSNIYNNDLENYGKNYKNYQDITAGDHIYYIDNTKDKSIYENVFGTPAKISHIVYKDPMDNIKHIQYREPLSVNERNKILNNTEPCLSFITDTDKHRQDIYSNIFRSRDTNSRTRR